MNTGVALSPLEQQEVVRTFKIGQKFNVVAYRGPSRITAEAMRIFLEKNPEQFDISPLVVEIEEIRVGESALLGIMYPIDYEVSFTARVLGFKKVAK